MADQKESSTPTKFIRFEDTDGNVHSGIQTTEGKAKVITGSIFGNYSTAESESDVAKLLCPLESTPAIIGIGLNYAKHVAESNMDTPQKPMYFFKNPSALTGPTDDIVIPAVCNDEVDYEIELALVIGKKAKDVPKERAFEYVLGYATANDVSARKWQLNKPLAGGQFNRGKGFDTFCPIGPCIYSADGGPSEGGINPDNLKLGTKLNGEVVQDDNTNDLIFNCAELVEFLSQDTTLLPGTVILTGTPSGVGWVRDPPKLLTPGDKVECWIETIGSVTNNVVAKSS